MCVVRLSVFHDDIQDLTKKYIKKKKAVGLTQVMVLRALSYTHEQTNKRSNVGGHVGKCKIGLLIWLLIP